MLESPTKRKDNVKNVKLKIGKTSSALIIALLLAASSITIAVAYTLPKPATVTIISLLGVYSDPECTHEITSIDLGSAHRGGWTEQLYIYVKNLGNTTVTLDAYSDLDITIGNVHFGFDKKTLTPGEVCPMFISCLVNENATAGTYSFNIYIDAA